MAAGGLLPEQRLIVAFDYPSMHTAAAEKMLEIAGQYGVGVKIGTEITARTGWVDPVTEAQAMGAEVFADTKLCDIPNTVGNTARTVLATRPYMVNMHASSGRDSMEALVEMRGKTQRQLVANDCGSLLLAVTVLTSKGGDECLDEYNGRPRRDQVRYYAVQAADAEMDGVVCAPEDLELLMDSPKARGLYKVTPAIRPAWAAPNDQKNYTTPTEAFMNGATHVVVGRPITQPPESVGSSEKAIELILEEIRETA